MIWSLAPPLVAIVLALMLRRVLFPLAVGVFLGVVLLGFGVEASIDEIDSASTDPAATASVLLETTGTDPAAVDPNRKTVTGISSRSEGLLRKTLRFAIDIVWSTVADADHFMTLLFSLLFGCMVGILEAGGSVVSLLQRMAGPSNSATGNVSVDRSGERTDRSSPDRNRIQRWIAASGLLIFFDDYANTLLVGGTMRGPADAVRISREKLAYLVDSTASPIAGLSLISTWTAVEISLMGEGLIAGGIDDTRLITAVGKCGHGSHRSHRTEGRKVARKTVVADNHIFTR